MRLIAPKDARLILLGHSENDDARVLIGRIGPDVPEVHIGRHEDTPFLSRDLTEARVLDTRETLAPRRGGFVPCVPERCGDVFGKVLVDLERERSVRHYAAPGTSGMTRSRASSAA